MLDKFLAITSASPPRGIVHVGAHVGQEILEYKTYDPDVLVWIEAEPENFALLEKTLSQDWGLTGKHHFSVNALVSDTDGEVMDFHLFHGGQSSSIFEATELFDERYPGSEATGEVIRMESKTLHTILSELGVIPSQVDHLVLDTQGSEMKCLRGLGAYINNLNYITAEVSVAELYAGGARMHELDDYLGARGFLRISHDPDYEHGDALYFRIPPKTDHSQDTPGDFDETRDIAMRNLANAIISQFNTLGDNPDALGLLEDDMLVLYRNHKDLLALPHNREVCIMMTRMAFHEDMKEAFPVFLRLL